MGEGMQPAAPHNDVRLTSTGGVGVRGLILSVLAATLGALALTATPALAAGDANMSQCPFETESSPGFRTYLPDCRAYELVTPVYGGGQPPFGLFHLSPPMSANGEHLLGIDFAAYAGTENLEEYGLEYGAVYEYSRSAAGWNAEALDPPASEFPRSDFKFASADLSRSLWEVVLPAHSGEEVGALPYHYDGFTLAVREAAGAGKGRFTLIGRVSAPKDGLETGDFDVMGASEDLSHILLSVTAEGEQLWPGDTTQPGSQSLYEYHDVGGQEPVLVGVRNEGAPPWTAGAAHLNEGAELLSQCGTQYDAVSAGGERVYFTAQECPGGPAVNELYVRIGGSETVKISGTGAAVFQGASTDGTKVFFTEEGSLYEYDFDAAEGNRVTLLAHQVASVAAVSEDGTRVYFNSEVGQNLYVYDTADTTPQITPPLSFVGQEISGERTTPDGEYLVFESTWPFAGTNDKSTVPQLFEYDASTGQIVRVSAGQRSPGVTYECAATKTFEEGYNCDGNTEASEFAPKATGASPESFFSKPTEASSHLTVTEDGAVAFTSALALTPGAVEGRVIAAGAGSRAENVYEYEAGHLYLISPADELSGIQVVPGQSRLLGIGETGKDVFFATTDSLVPQDTDTQYSWYDAREEGGFPAPVTPVPCQGSACQGPAPAAPSLTSPLTPPSVDENLVEPKPAVMPAAKPKAKRCKKGFVKNKKDKCVRSRAKNKARKATNDRRAGR
jgi:hypothetical protein